MASKRLRPFKRYVPKQCKRRRLPPAQAQRVASECSASSSDICLTASPPCDVIILDVHMPKMGGKEAAAIIRQQNALVPIIFLTGEIAVSMKECVKTFAPAYLLLKPSNKRTLVAFESRIDLVASSNTHSVHSSNALSNISASTTAPARAWVRSAMLNATQCACARLLRTGAKSNPAIANEAVAAERIRSTLSNS
eukprot:12248-Heterococcus_DN1.PRE.2